MVSQTMIGASEDSEPSVHWHAMTSFAGCLPETNDICETREDAIETIASLYPEYEDKLRRRLARDGVSPVKSLHAGYSTFYAEVCECNDPACQKYAGEYY